MERHDRQAEDLAQLQIEVRPLRRLLSAEIQQGEILPRLLHSHEAGQGYGAQAETKAELSRFRA